MSANQNENISPLLSGIPQRATGMAKRMPLRLSIPAGGKTYKLVEPNQPSTAPVNSMSKPFGGSKFNHTPEFVVTGSSPLANGVGRFGPLASQHSRLGDFEEMDDGFMLGSPLITGFDSNGSLQMGSLTASPEHSPLISQGTTGSTPSISHHLLPPLGGFHQHQHFGEMSDLAADTGSPGGTMIGPPTPPTRGLFGSSNASSSSSLASAGTASTAMTSSAAQELLNSSTSSSSKVSSTSSTSTTSRMAKTSSTQRLMSSSLTASSSLSSSSSKQSSSSSSSSAAAIKQGLGEMQNSMAEMKNMMGHSTASSQVSTSSSSTMSASSSSSQIKKQHITGSSSNLTELQKRLRSSMDSLDDPNPDYQVTHPDSDGEMGGSVIMMKPPNGMVVPQNGTMMNGGGSSVLSTGDTVKFEQKQTTSESKTKVVTDGFSSEQATVNSASSKMLQAGDVEYKEQTGLAAMSNTLEVDGVKTEEKGALLKEARSLKMGDFQQAEANNIAAHSVKVSSDHFSAEKKAISQAQQRQTVTASGVFNQEKTVSSATQSKFSSHSMVSSSSQMSTHSSSMNGTMTMGEDFPSFEDLERISGNPAEIENAIHKYSSHMTKYVENLHNGEQLKKAPNLLNTMNEIIRRAWAVPTHGHELGASLCDTLRTTGGLDILMKNCVDSDSDVQFSSARLLEQCLTTENRSHVVKNGLDKVVNVACVCTRNNATDHSRVGTGILEHLFKHSEDTCSNVIRLGGLDAVLFECRKNDVETLRHCAGALANLSLYGGAENQEAMINRKVPSWLFPLAFHHDENIKYYACLAIVVLVANKEIEAEVIKSGTLNLVEPFVTSHNPSEFAKSNLAHAHGQSKHWLERLVPVLSSKREEARNLAAFHFCMEAGIKKEQGNTNIFKEIGAIEPLIRVASSPNAIASKFAAQALRLIGEEVPHKLSQQVPLWNTEDVREWVKQIGFTEYEQSFFDSKVDGDLLLQLTEENLHNDIGMTNGIRRKRFERELQNLKRMADYSSRDSDGMHTFLYRIAPEYTIYTYAMLNAGVELESIKDLDDDQLIAECNIKNSIHRSRILNAIKSNEIISTTSEKSTEKNLDVFVSYRRSNGSQLASLLKVHLELRGFSVFIDVERLEAGKFDNNLLQSIRHAKHFLLVLTQDALDRCIEDGEGKDWVHREIVAALNSDCNIIPIIDNFQWPEPERLPEDMRGVCHFNGVRWIHDYQDACVDKLERYIRNTANRNGRSSASSQRSSH
ncbi:NAD(+) hydrolase sarm1 isoform X2 [Culex pipiens pallens]|uniref:NAD(+) hydrolase sarm1 isoform X2 n=1 Tax=Culex pipiens pallens TaxID=42434 RepID=UPI0019533496|nr:NAD(+) hydrolase sarm1 isoform X2 [Culex pipiens pallens]